MPVIKDQRYKPPAYLLSPHMETMFPHVFRSINPTAYTRERIYLPDSDFLDLDWIKRGHERLIVLCHGLEGSAHSKYMVGMALSVMRQNWDALALNFRSCSGEINDAIRMYHHGEIEDLSYVLSEKTDQYKQIALVGFSLGGNVIIKFTAIKRHQLKRIKAVIAISTPCDLASSSKALDRWDNQIYSWRFRRSLLKKFKQKALQYPNLLELSKFDKVKTWHDFDNVFTTKLTGFRDADEYYAQGSANNFLAYVTVPTFILNATNDPFLEEPSYPRRIANESPFIHLEMPKYGGHVGYWYPGRGQSYAEERCLAFLEEFVSKS